MGRPPRPHLTGPVTGIREAGWSRSAMPRATGAGETVRMEPHVTASPAAQRPSWMHRISVATIGLARPLAGRRGFPLWAVVEHRGRSTGTVRHTPVVARRTAHGFVIPVPFGPTTQWTQNVLAAGGAIVRWKGRDWRVAAPRLVGFQEGAAALGGIQRPIARRAGIVTYLTVDDAD
jgi:deazaflavin-dependent oxidoreductase (nitroreductase family)